jgi:hypothetical protein
MEFSRFEFGYHQKISPPKGRPSEDTEKWLMGFQWPAPKRFFKIRFTSDYSTGGGVESHETER